MHARIILDPGKSFSSHGSPRIRERPKGWTDALQLDSFRVPLYLTYVFERGVPLIKFHLDHIFSRQDILSNYLNNFQVEIYIYRINLLSTIIFKIIVTMKKNIAPLYSTILKKKMQFFALKRILSLILIVKKIRRRSYCG